ncbi:SRPBCC family protein [Mycobacterium sp. Dal123C01]|uniref:SRPBCC family protein n=1 Tax=Mycobacterium sp. Dal123C01 TaxID=3457577 RepID=UPI00403E6D21
MTGSLSCRVEQLSSAKPAAIYDLLMDVERWSEFMPTVSAASWERRGEPDTEKGGVRRMRFGLMVIRDRIVDGTRPHHQAYAASFPWYLPLKDYRGDIRIDEGPDGCRIIWTVTCASSRIPGIEKSLKSSYTRLAAALAHEAEGTTRTK